MPLERIVAFMHIEKTAGSTFLRLLERHFGRHHIIVDRGATGIYQPLGRRVYSPEDLRRDVKLYRSVKSLSGHRLQPLLDFEEYQDRLDWVTILREPLARYISNYQHSVEKGGEIKDFKAWMKQPHFWNGQVRKLTGGDDVEAAKRRLATQFCCVGLTEHFDASLLLLRERLGLQNFEVGYVKPVNPSKGEVRRRIMADWEEYRDMVTEANRLDCELYQFVLDELWPKQIAEYGEERLKQDLGKEFQVKGFKLRHCYRYWENVVFRRLIHGPYLWFYRRCFS